MKKKHSINKILILGSCLLIMGFILPTLTTASNYLAASDDEAELKTFVTGAAVLPSSVSTFDPHINFEGATMIITQNVLEGFFMLDPQTTELKYINALATEVRWMTASQVQIDIQLQNLQHLALHQK